MKIKLDENLGASVARLLIDAGMDVATVHEQRLSGATDQKVAQVCAGESRVLVTMDLDFANPLRFPPDRSAGIVVIRIPSPCTIEGLKAAAETFIAYSRTENVHGKLWIIEPGQVRIYQPESDLNKK